MKSSGEAQSKKNHDSLPLRHIAAKYLRQISSQATGMGVAIEDYCACWIEIAVDEPSDMDVNQVVLLGTDFRYRLNGRPIAVRMRQD
jgi:hypothetical protein